MRNQFAPIMSYAVATGVALALIGARWWATGRPALLYLPWNLFLAWLPLGFAWVAHYAAGRTSRPPGATVVSCLVWLVFYPNAPYVLTDLLHVTLWYGARSPLPWWFDFFVHLHFALVALLVGYVSLATIHRLAERYYGSRVAWGFVAASQLLAGFGLYLGRVRRWNSWDLVRTPRPLFDDLADGLVNGRIHGHPIGFALLSGVMLLLGYWMCRTFAASPLASPGPDGPPAPAR